jgi:hypothetical protein
MPNFPSQPGLVPAQRAKLEHVARLGLLEVDSVKEDPDTLTATSETDGVEQADTLRLKALLGQHLRPTEIDEVLSSLSTVLLARTLRSLQPLVTSLGEQVRTQMMELVIGNSLVALTL